MLSLLHEFGNNLAVLSPEHRGAALSPCLPMAVRRHGLLQRKAAPDHRVQRPGRGEIGVRPCGWTVSGCCFDRLSGASFLELRRAEIAQGGIPAFFAVNLFDKAGQVCGDVLERLIGRRRAVRDQQRATEIRCILQSAIVMVIAAFGRAAASAGRGRCSRHNAAAAGTRSRAMLRLDFHTAEARPRGMPCRVAVLAAV